MTLKTTEDVRARLDVAANASGRSLTHEVEHLVGKALDAETLEATLRRVVREEIERRIDPPPTVTFRCQDGGRLSVDAVYVAHRVEGVDAISIMSEAQH